MAGLWVVTEGGGPGLCLFMTKRIPHLATLITRRVALMSSVHCNLFHPSVWGRDDPNHLSVDRSQVWRQLIQYVDRLSVSQRTSPLWKSVLSETSIGMSTKTQMMSQPSLLRSQSVWIYYPYLRYIYRGCGESCGPDSVLHYACMMHHGRMYLFMSI
jgi:hypothetical protein